MRYTIRLYEAIFLNPSSPALVLFLLIATSLITWRSWSWVNASDRRRESWLAFCTILGFSLLDWALLLALPRLQLSFGPVNSGLAAITLLRIAGMFAVVSGGLAWNVLRRERSATASAARVSPILLSLLILNLGILSAELYSLVYEPFNLGTSRLTLQSPVFLENRPLRIVHLTDIHVERITKRERQMLAVVQNLHPDLIVLTGDYLNIDYVNDPLTQQHGAQVLSQLSAPYGVYAILAPGVDQPQAMQQVFSSVENIIVLQDEIKRIDLPNQPLYLVGISKRSIPRDSAVLHNLMAQLPDGAFSMLLYHTPDLAYAAAQEEVDLYLAGHTHGGQIRLPFYGAVVTFSAFGKQFEMGRYQIEQTTLYVSRGIGMEGLRLPRVRFLCPPEIVLIELGGGTTP